MRVVRDVDLLSEGPDRSMILRVSAVIMAAAVVCSLALGALSPGGPFPWPGCALVALCAYGLSIPVHELLHAVGFLALGPRGTKVRFGYSSGMVFASSPGTSMERGRFCAVLLLSTVVLTCVYAVVAVILGPWSLPWAVLVALVQLSGAAGDLVLCAVIARTPQADLCQDTDRGVRLLARA